MGKRNEKAKKDVKAWLLGIEKQVGCPVVVSLLIQDQDIEFVNLVTKKRSIVADDGDDSEPSVDIDKYKKEGVKKEQNHSLNYQSYIG